MWCRCGVDDISAEHFVYAFLSHGYLPDNIMKNAMVSIIKNNSGDSCKKKI